MKHIRLDQSGGAPFKQKTLNKIQESYFELFFSMLDFIGVNTTVGNYIINGCNVVGPNITSGWLFIDGDLLKFLGSVGDSTTKLKKAVTAETVAFKNGTNLPFYYESSVVIDATGVELNSFTRINPIPVIPPNIVLDPADLTTTPPQPTVLQRLAKLEEMTRPLLNKGTILLWMKPLADIPVGWQECVNFRGRLPMGMDITVDGGGNFVNPEFAPLTTGANDPGRTGGSKTKTLTKPNLPAINVDTTKTGSKVAGDAGGYDPLYRDVANANIGGNSTAFDVLNPYRTVIFIEYVG